MSEQSVAIVTDSAASLPPGGGPIVVPMKLILDGEELRDGLDLTATEFYRRLRSLNDTPTTSGPSPRGSWIPLRMLQGASLRSFA